MGLFEFKNLFSRCCGDLTLLQKTFTTVDWPSLSRFEWHRRFLSAAGAGRNGFNFDSRKLSIESVNDTKRESCEDSQADAAKRKSRSRGATNDKTCNRDLVWCDSGFAKERDYRGFDWRMDVSWEIQGALLRRIQDDALSETTFV